MSILRRIQPGIEFRVVIRKIDLERTQEFARDFAHAYEPVRIALPVAQHHVLFGAQVVVAAVFGEDQPVDQELVPFAIVLTKTRAAHARQCFFFDIAQQQEQILPGFALDDLLAHLERRHPLAIFERLLLAHALITLQHHPAAFQHLRELRVQFQAQELDHCQPRQQIDGDIVLGLGAVQRGHVQFRQRRFEVRGLALCPGLHHRRELIEKRRPGRRWSGFGGQQAFHVAVARDQAGNMRARRIGKLRAEMNIMPEIVHAHR